MKALLFLASLLAFTGCAGPRVVPAGPDTFTVSAGGGGRFPASSTALRAKVYQAANDFCAARGLVMVPVSVDQRPAKFGSHTASFDLVFRALPPGDPDIKRPNVERPDYIERVEER